MGAAISVMHYIAMAAASFTASAVSPTCHTRCTSLPSALPASATVIVMVQVAALMAALVDRLQERNALLGALFEQAPQAIALLKADGRVISANRQFTRVFGYRPQETLGRSLMELIVPGELQNEFQCHLELAARGGRFEDEVVRQRKGGARLHVLAVGVPVSLTAGQIALCFEYLDITKSKEAETALQEVSTRLLEVQWTEENRLALELHDEIGQLLTGLRLLLSPDEDLAARLRTALSKRGPLSTNFSAGFGLWHLTYVRSTSSSWTASRASHVLRAIYRRRPES